MSTLSKFGVPMGGGSGRGGLLMPKLKYRFRVRFVNFGPIAGGLELSQQVMRVSKPSLNFDEVTLDAYNSRAYVHGKHTWGDCTLTLRDDITNAVSKLVGHQVQKQLNHFEQTAYAAGQNYKFNMMIETMDGGNDVVLEKWSLEGCWIKDANFEELDYSASEAQSISLTVRFDNATMEDGLFTEAPDIIPGFRA